MPDGSCYFPPPLLDPGRAAWYAPFLRALGELPLRPPALLTIRLLYLPTWGGAAVVRVEDCGIRWRCTVGELDGDAGYEVGKLIRREHFELTSSHSARLEEMWRYLRFWELPSAVEGEDELDATEYVLEAIDGIQHHLISRECWEWGDTFGEFVILLLGAAGLYGR